MSNGLDPNRLYDDYRQSLASNLKLKHMALRKAFNLPVDDPSINASTTTVQHNGVPSWLALALSALMAASGIGGGIGLAKWLAAPATVAPAIVSQEKLPAQKYRVTFSTEDGAAIKPSETK